MLRVGIIGVGTVGASVANILRDNKNIITARAGKEIVPTIGVVSNLHKTRNVDIKLTDNISAFCKRYKPVVSINLLPQNSIS